MMIIFLENNNHKSSQTYNRKVIKFLGNLNNELALAGMVVKPLVARDTNVLGVALEGHRKSIWSNGFY